ncbi:hypothetical protein AHF37_05673 [Paragonimus kellicotti]|nr:hypothetical protein AHF37_05673 [Paragonimus kellicotti]
MQQAQRQIDELTRMLHAKDLALRQKEQENIRLNDVLHSLQRTIRHGGAILNSTAGDPRSAVPTDHSKRQQQEFHGSHSHRRRSPEHSTTSYAHSQSYDPRPDGSVHHNRTDQPRKPRSKSREKIRQSSPGRIRSSATNSRPEAVSPLCSVVKSYQSDAASGLDDPLLFSIISLHYVCVSAHLIYSRPDKMIPMVELLFVLTE